MHTTVTTHVSNSMHRYIHTAMPSVHIVIVYKCRLVYITPLLMITQIKHNKHYR